MQMKERKRGRAIAATMVVWRSPFRPSAARKRLDLPSGTR